MPTIATATMIAATTINHKLFKGNMKKWVITCFGHSAENEATQG
jgi:hypothetical protein